MESYYQMVERDSSTVSNVWKIAHIVTFLLAITSGVTTTRAMDYVTYSFGGHCVLYSDIKFADVELKPKSFYLPFLNTTTVPEHLKPIESPTTRWGLPGYCNFCQFAPLATALVAAIMTLFFSLSAKGGAGYITDTFYQPWLLVYPTFFLSLVAFSSLAWSLSYLNEGMKMFCVNFGRIDIEGCSTEINKYTLVFHKVERNLIESLYVVWYGSITCFLAWLIQFFILVLRVTCIADFIMLKIDIINIENEERVQAVIMSDEESLAPIAEEDEEEPETSNATPETTTKKKMLLISVTIFKSKDKQTPADNQQTDQLQQLQELKSTRLPGLMSATSFSNKRLKSKSKPQAHTPTDIAESTTDVEQTSVASTESQGVE